MCITFPWLYAHKEFEKILKDGGVKKKEQAKFKEDGILEPVYTREDGEKFVFACTKFRSLKTKGMLRILPKGGVRGFFGWHLVKAEHDTVIVTEGEYDAMAVAEGLQTLAENNPMRNIPAISLPNGCNSLPAELVDLLRRFKLIILWMDGDTAGKEAAQKFTDKLGIKRTLCVASPNIPEMVKDANDALRLREKYPTLIEDMIQKAEKIRHQDILYSADLRRQVMDMFKNHKQSIYEGCQASSFPRLNTILKGFRSGELIVFTGPTGSGKTTFLSQLSIDIAREGYPVLWGSFEIKNPTLVKKMVQQYHKEGSLENIEHNNLELVFDDFENLPIKFLNFYGSTDINRTLDVMKFSHNRDDTKYIIIDNLQFMMPRVSANHGHSVFTIQDQVLDQFRVFATKYNITVFLVIHPRKEDVSKDLSVSSIFGTAKASQEADSILILQKNESG